MSTSKQSSIYRIIHRLFLGTVIERLTLDSKDILLELSSCFTQIRIPPNSRIPTEKQGLMVVL